MLFIFIGLFLPNFFPSDAEDSIFFLFFIFPPIID